MKGFEYELKTHFNFSCPGPEKTRIKRVKKHSKINVLKCVLLIRLRVLKHFFRN
jgi:hypothetical protein